MMVPSMVCPSEETNVPGALPLGAANAGEGFEATTVAVGGVWGGILTMGEAAVSDAEANNVSPLANVTSVFALSFKATVTSLISHLPSPFVSYAPTGLLSITATCAAMRGDENDVP